MHAVPPSHLDPPHPCTVLFDQHEIWERQVFPGMRRNIRCFDFFSLLSLFMLSFLFIHSKAWSRKWRRCLKKDVTEQQGVVFGCTGWEVNYTSWYKGPCHWLQVVLNIYSPVTSIIVTCTPLEKPKPWANAHLALWLPSIPVCLNI